MTNDVIGGAVSSWLREPAVAEKIYGHISTWNTRMVTGLSRLFCEGSFGACFQLEEGWSAAADFNDDISGWDVSKVTIMYYSKKLNRVGSSGAWLLLESFGLDFFYAWRRCGVS
jgi:hypothetical protein